MKTTILFLLTIFCLSAASAAAQTKTEDFWIGEYDYTETGMNANETRSYAISHSLEIKREDGKLRAYYSVTENGNTRGDRGIFDVQINGDNLTLLYNSCDRKNREEAETDETECTSDFKTGDLMFKLVKTTAKNKKLVILTYWGKIKPVNRSGKVYFKRAAG